MINRDIFKNRRRKPSGPLGKAGAFLRRLVGRPQGEESGTTGIDRDQFIAPRQSRWLTETFSNFAGTRQYRLFIPSAYRDEPLPLIIMLHGCSQSPDDFAAGTRMNFFAEQRGCIVAYPGQSKSANGLRCWNWFNARHQHRGRGEPSLIAGITRQIMQNYAIDPSRVYIAGLSAGGAATAIMAATYPDLYAAAGVHSGLARGAARTVPAAYSAMRSGQSEIAPEVTLSPISLTNRRRVPIIIFHGDRDETVNVRNSDQVLDQAWPSVAMHYRHKQTKRQVKGGHSYTRTRYLNEPNTSVAELWIVHNSGHAWSGGHSAGSYTDPAGPDASGEMIRFFLSHQLDEAKIAEQAAQ